MIEVIEVGLEAVARRCFVKKVFIELSQTSQENTFVRVSLLIKLQAKACDFSKTTFPYKTPPVAASLGLVMENFQYIN